MNILQTGNVNVDTNDTRGWIVGQFFQDNDDLKYSKDVEIKWGAHTAGEMREEWVTDETRTSIGILISGTFIMEFRDRELTFDKQGDYVIWGPGTDHRWRAAKDSVWLTVRWPSLAS